MIYNLQFTLNYKYYNIHLMSKSNTKQRIIDYISSNKEASPKDLSLFLEISPQALFRHLKTLIDNNSIEKIGSSPKVFYRISSPSEKTHSDIVSNEDTLFLEKHFYFVSPVGQSYSGLDAMKAWCDRQNLPLQKTINDYKLTLANYDSYKVDSFIDGIDKMHSTFKSVFLD